MNIPRQYLLCSENVQEGERDLRRQGEDCHPDVRARGQAHSQARLRPGQV